MFQEIFLSVTIIIVLAWIYLIFFYKQKKRLSVGQINYYKKILRETDVKMISNKEKLITCDMIYHDILKKMWYKWTFWEILKNKPWAVNNLSDIWELHKLRNKLVHEIEVIDDKFLEKKVKNYVLEIDKLLK